MLIGEPSGGTLPFLVAASDAPDEWRAVSNYVCTGTDDHLVINQAIDDAMGTNYPGGAVGTNHVTLSPGNFYLAGQLTGSSNDIGVLQGSGANGQNAIGSILHATVDINATLIPFTQVVRDVEIVAWGHINTVIALTTGTVTNVAIGMNTTGSPSIDVGIRVDQAGFGRISGVVIQGAGVGINALAGSEVSIAASIFARCAKGVVAVTDAIFGDATASIAGSSFVDIPTNGVGAHADGGALSIAGCAFLGQSGSTGNIGVDNDSGTLNGAITSANLFVDVTTAAASGSPGEVVVSEVDTDGHRIPIRDEAGVVQGYLGWSASMGGLAIWKGDGTGFADTDSPYYSITGGDLFLTNATWSAWLSVEAAGTAKLKGSTATVEGDDTTIWGNDTVDIDADTAITGKVRFFNSTNAPAGINGTDTPATAAELADVLVNLGIIASHTIT